jgi:hypothetical protein
MMQPGSEWVDPVDVNDVDNLADTVRAKTIT